MHRQTGLAIVHIAAKKLGMDPQDPRQEREYRKFLRDHTGKSSAADLNPVEMRKVIQAFEERGFRSKTTERETKSFIRVIKKLWHQISRGVDEQASLRRFVFKHCPKAAPLKGVSDLDSKGWRELEDLELHELKDLYDMLRSYTGARW